jgi:hypothetical protein
MEAALGPVWYRRALAFALWRPQIALGGLVPVLYALVKDGSSSVAVRPASVVRRRKSASSSSWSSL